MAEVRALPAPIVPQGWGDVDTSVDNEIPELLSDEQLERYVETVAELLRAARLEVTGPEASDPGHLEVRRPNSALSLEIDIREDRSADWSLSGDDESAPGTRALGLAGFLTRLLEPEGRGR